MPLDPDENPRAFVTIAVAAAILVFGDKTLTIEDCYDCAEAFVKQAEIRYGKINP